MADILKGAPVAAAITDDLINRAESLTKRGVAPQLAILRVGSNESDLAYERAAVKRCEKIGIKVRQIVLDAACSEQEVCDAINDINSDTAVHGCLMFRPLPKNLDEHRICERLAPAKDVDAMTDRSLVHVFTGKGEGFAPCTAQSCIEILKYYGYELTGKKVAVIGRSLVIGKPVSMLLQQENATVTMCHTRTADLAGTCKDSEILVVAAGRAGMVNETFTNKNQVVIDVGINVDSEGNLCGDVDFAKVEPVCAAITPVPGGVGSVTTAVLCKHVIEAAEKSS